jgi:asparagine N-glycosylation enzyme membrane subunit Stt3
MSENKYSFRNEIKFGLQKEKEARALKDFNRNRIGLYFSAVVFFIVLLTTLCGVVLNKNLMMIFLVASLTGVFFFGRELKVIAKGQILFSVVKALLCLGMAGAFIVMHQGLWDVMDYCILGILVGVVLLDIPRVIKAWKELK